jgi:hypothetical protein
MTRALPFTEQSLRRAIAAARKEGLQVTGIRPDGTILVANTSPHNEKLDVNPPDAARWSEVEA